MPTLYVTEFSGLAIDDHGQSIMSPDYKKRTAKWSMAITGSHTESQAFASNTTFIKFNVDATCSIDIAAAPVAVATADRIAINDTQFVGVEGGWKISVISNT